MGVGGGKAYKETVEREGENSVELAEYRVGTEEARDAAWHVQTRTSLAFQQQQQ